MRILTARWSRGRDLVEDLPDFIHWNDGTSGTIGDYTRNLTNTHTLDHEQHGWVMRFFPEIIAKVWFDVAARTWVVSGEGIQTESLQLSDPNASDEMIRADLYALETLYRAEIIRESVEAAR